ncbi:hypothetical protein MJO28_014313 [Puccinia striiformis f. sp. tritici]|uniref:Uncharacterized protein n=1 Tax=Puccinia striiformis f. sp. tritici TaxID=168172 RepID=A0ACC0DT66_9BASI|nr:hypothetical protein MJO28_014313 [Puccinia striiformis f. sp. tritici]
MDALAITPMCLRVAFAMDNRHGYIPLWEDDPNYIEECQREIRENMAKCCCSNCDEENSIKLIDNLPAASVSNFDSIVSDKFTASKSYDLKAKYPKRHTGTRKRKILPDERLEMDKFKLSMIKELHAYYYTIFKRGGSLMPKHLFADEEAEAIVNSFHNITTIQKLQRVIGVEAFVGQLEWLFKWINVYKENRDKEINNKSGGESEDVLESQPSKRIKTAAIRGVSRVSLDSAEALDHAERSPTKKMIAAATRNSLALERQAYNDMERAIELARKVQVEGIIQAVKKDYTSQNLRILQP